MSATFNVSGGNTTITINYTAVTAKVQDTIGNAALNLWNRGLGDHGTEETPITFDSLTNQQKLNLVDEYVLRIIRDLAKTQNILTQSDAAKSTAESENETKFI